MVRENTLDGLNSFELIGTCVMAHTMLCLGKYFICTWKDWLFASPWVQCSSRTIGSHGLIELFKSPISLLLFCWVMLPIIERGMLVLGFVSLGLKSAPSQLTDTHRFLPCTAEPATWGTLCRVPELFSAQLPPPAQYPIWHLIPAASSASISDLCSYHAVSPLLHVWAPLPCEVVWTVVPGRS